MRSCDARSLRFVFQNLVGMLWQRFFPNREFRESFEWQKV
jgi:hypothetical protein